MNALKLEKIKKYIMNLPIEICDLNNPTLKLFGTVEKVTPNAVFILLDSTNINSEIYLNKDYGVKIFRDNSLFSFQGILSSIQNKIACVRIISPITKIQNRNYCRLKILARCQLKLPDFNLVKDAILYNISEGGLAVVTSQILLEKDEVLLDIPALNLNDLKGVVLKELFSPYFEAIPKAAAIKFITSIDTMKIKSLEEFINTYNKAYSIEFAHENQKNPDIIRKFIFNTQLKKNEENKLFTTY